MTIDRILNPSKTTKEQVLSALNLTVAVAEAIRTVGGDGVPSGTLYALLCAKVDLSGYEAIIRTLKNAGLVAEKNNLLTWVCGTKTRIA